MSGVCNDFILSIAFFEGLYSYVRPLLNFIILNEIMYLNTFISLPNVEK
jgi:hypothetical protein